MQNCPRQLAMQSCALCLYVRCGSSNQIHKEEKKAVFAFSRLSESWKTKFQAENLTMEDLKGYISQFVTAAQQEENGWPNSWCDDDDWWLTMMTVLQHREFDKQPERNIIVNNCCPGLVDTDMTGGRYANPLTTDEAADKCNWTERLFLSASSYYFINFILF